MRKYVAIILIVFSLSGCAGITDYFSSPASVDTVPAPAPMVVTIDDKQVEIEITETKSGETKGQRLGRIVSETGSKLPGPLGLVLWSIGGVFASMFGKKEEV